MNELGVVVAQYFTYTTSILEVEEGLLLVAARYEAQACTVSASGEESCDAGPEVLHRALS